MSTVVGNLRAVLGLDSSAFQSGLQAAAGSLQSVGRRMQSIGKGMSAGITAPLVAVGAAATASFVSSTRQLSDLQRQADIAGMSVQQFKVASLAVREYGVDQDKLSDILKDVNDKFGDFTATGAGPLADFFENIAPKVGLTIDSFKGLSSSDALAKYVTALEDANVSQSEMTFYMEALANDATALVPAFRNGGAAIAAMETRAKELGLSLDDDLIKNARQTGADFAIVSDIMRTQFQQAMVGLAPAISQLAASMAPLMEHLINGIKWLAEWTARLSEVSPEALKVGLAIGAAVAALGPMLIGVGLMLQGLGPFVAILKGVAFAASALGAPFTLAAIAIAAAATAIYMNWDSVGPWFKDLWEGVKQTFAGWSEFLKGFYTGDIPRAVDGLKQAFSGLGNFFSTLLDGIGLSFEALPDRIRAPFQEIIDMLDRVDAAGRATERFMTRITGGGAASGGTTAPSGSDVIAPPTSEMLDGLAGGTAGIRVQGVTDADAYSSGFREGMGIQSPSKKMIEYGEYIAQGLGNGISNGQPHVAGATDGLGKSILGTMQPYFSGILDNARNLTDVFDNIKSSFANMLSDMASRMMQSGLSGLLGNLIGSFDPLAGALRGAGLNAIPAFATGTNYAPGGLSRINELGGEIINLPRGSQVIPHDLSKDMMRGQGGGQVVVRLQLSDDIDARIMQGAGQAADVRIERFASNELPGRVSAISQYERERM